jgi:hypothetical protein
MHIPVSQFANMVSPAALGVFRGSARLGWGLVSSRTILGCSSAFRDNRPAIDPPDPEKVLVNNG